MSNRLHIVCLDAPSPPDYGGAIDMYYKVKAIAETGKKIVLHYFMYKNNRGVGELAELCEEVYSYSRKGIFSIGNFKLPYIVNSRISSELIERLNKDHDPLILEGLHTSGIIPFLNNPGRVVLRMHNEESGYYSNLAHAETSFFKKIYFKREARLLRNYQLGLQKSIRIACLSTSDREIFEKEYGISDLHFIPCFIPWQQFSIMTGKGDYCLFHGNLAVSENIQAVIWLIEKVFGLVEIPFVISGSSIPPIIEEKIKGLHHIKLVPDPSIEALEDLIRHAHINVLPSLNTTGVKLKLLHALFSGRFCITNHEGIKGSGIESGVHIAETADQFRTKVIELMNTDFIQENIEARKNILPLYNNRTNAEKLNALY
jgi:glycosyltransferase involved in cell wall biosynthesis